ncbi:MAG: hypothetical protein ABW168_21515 [Sedimenticola sp.]
MPQSTSKNVPDFNVSQIMEIPGKDKAKFYTVGVGYHNSDGSINLMTVHGNFRISAVKPSNSK